MFTIQKTDPDQECDVYFIVYELPNGRCIILDHDWAWRFGVTTEKYHDIFKKYKIKIINNSLYFNTKKEAQKAINEVYEPIIIANKLLNEI